MHAFLSARPLVCGGGVIPLSGPELSLEFVATIVTHNAPQLQIPLDIEAHLLEGFSVSAQPVVFPLCCT